MKKQTLGLSVASCLVVLSQTAWAAGFVVRDIEVNGLERVPAGTVLNYLPARIGQAFDDQQTGNAIKALFGTGLFDDVLVDYCDSLKLPIHISFVKNTIYKDTNYIYSIYCVTNPR